MDAEPDLDADVDDVLGLGDDDTLAGFPNFEISRFGFFPEIRIRDLDPIWHPDSSLN